MTQLHQPDNPGTQAAILHRRGGNWSCMLASIDGMHSITVVETTSIERTNTDALQAWIDARNVEMIRVIIPGSSIICRTCSLPDANPDQLEEALQLQAESRLLGTAPMHRTATAMLPASAHTSTRTGLILAWPEVSDFIGPDLETEPLYIPDIAALSSLVDGLHPKNPAIWLDRDDGTVSMVLAQQERVHVRATNEHLSDAATTRESIQRLLLETALKAGSSPESSHSIAEQAGSRLDDIQEHQILMLPESVINLMRERIKGVTIDQAWMNEWGICAGAALAMSDDLIPLTLFRYSLPEETPSLGEVAMKRLSTMEVAAWLAVVAILILAFGPLLVNGIRVTTLSILHPGLGNRIQAYEDHQHQEVMYSALMSEAWPMSKLLADVSSNTPEGIELESIRIGHGEPIKVQGMAKPNSGEESSALATRMKAMFQSSGVFDDVTLRWEDSETYGTRSFDISATVRRPQYRPAYALDQDFGHWTLSERRSGQDPEGNWTDDGTVMIASGSSTPSESSTTRSIPPSGNAGSSNVRGATGASSSNSTSTPSISTPTGSPGVERPPTGRNGNTSSRSPRSGANGFSSRGDADDRSADLSTVPTGRLPEPLSEDQIKTFTLEESRIKLQEIAEARKQTRDPEAEKRLKNEFQMLLKHMRDLNRGGG